MAELTIKRARKILGKMAESIPDSELEKEIKAAKLLKEIFFASYAKRRTNSYNEINAKT